MGKQHHYKTKLEWTGNRGEGTKTYTSYDRAHSIYVATKEIINASSDPSFRGDASKYNPEELLVASLSSCHMLWYLHLCADAGVIVTDYEDNAQGLMEEDDKGGRFVEVILYPQVTVENETMIEKAKSLHDIAHQKCFIANSVNFPVKHEVEVKVL